jgi:hypothetical protein
MEGIAVYRELWKPTWGSLKSVESGLWIRVSCVVAPNQIPQD